MNLATEHIRNNLNLFGFGTQKTAVLQGVVMNGITIYNYSIFVPIFLLSY